MGNAEKQTKQKIMTIAREHFSRYGYAGTNLEAIGKEAGLTRGPLYYYFKNKKELYQTVIEQEKETVIGQYQEIFEQPCSIFEKLEILFSVLPRRHCCKRSVLGDRGNRRFRFRITRKRSIP